MLTATITYAATSGLPKPEHNFSETEFTLKQGETTFTAPTLTSATDFDGTVTYFSDNEDVATVNSSTGEVTIKGGAGTATITAHSAETANFAEGSASYTITVIPVFSSLAALKSQITAASSTAYVTLTDAVVTYVNGSYAYIEEGETGLVYYNRSHGMEAGNVLNGTMKVTTTIYYGLDEITSLDASEGTITTGGTISTTTATIAELNASPSTYDSRRVKISGATVTTVQSGTSATLSQGDATLALYLGSNTFKALGTVGNTVDVIGYLYYYNSELQFRVWEEPTLVSGKVDPNLSFSATTATANLGESFTAPTLSNPNGVTVTYSSSNTAVATVNANTGAVTINAAGTTTITASFDGDESYNAGDASYTLTVVDPNKVYYYKKVTRQSDIVDGGVYLIASPNSDYFAGAQSTTNTKYRTVVDASTVGTTLTGGLLQINQSAVNVSGVPYEVTLVESSTTGEYALQILGSEGTEAYLVHNSSSNDVTEGESSDAEGGLWTLTYNENGTVNIENNLTYTYNKVEGSVGHLRFNSSAERFATYTTQQDPVLYRRVEVGQLTIGTEEGYATYFTDQNFEMPAGVTGTTITGVDAEGNLTAAWEYTEGAEVPANTALLVKGDKGTYYYAILDDVSATTPEDNLLNGYTTATQIPVDNTKCFYKLTYSDDDHVLGFYWGEENGGSFLCSANKAYLSLTRAQNAHAKGFSFGDNGEITSITGVKQSQSAADAAVYSLKGVRLNGNLDSQTKGLYIVNGKKVLVK
ncbi:MAG: Ig-like domain-containing protein [Bacteroidales bacterium]|nr:Ig-like domain-containing protein [Bacteroidales bacterium]